MADELTPAEKAYLESGGENAEGLIAESKGEPVVETKPEPKPQPEVKAEEKPAE